MSKLKKNWTTNNEKYSSSGIKFTFYLFILDLVDVLHVEANYRVDDEQREIFFFRYKFISHFNHLYILNLYRTFC